mmetsp:Transcript_18333/g.41835  ORF Transcript_18333/g.41835 Transcript_18333/m.41835 type:complete len:351 (-) Transcript_18333:1539-2591(-)|eukprot:CAMPEP_0201129464 /NCGR_PEP_ID=MMETSP0850-20130426/37036_1 /ASSEMBLY_ACC=CAM_ASM_000622 /TAXON_ID=183588 /ORGANISM="Pseudo-nitzschia fraudulenta, Strain WWA7" /LENGTH=350 /DNA_ID=CAMNT_0047398941 /DNA_START=75 /DNA_END=1127 /DNA_ORIENTATION=-
MSTIQNRVAQQQRSRPETITILLFLSFTSIWLLNEVQSFAPSPQIARGRCSYSRCAGTSSTGPLLELSARSRNGNDYPGSNHKKVNGNAATLPGFEFFQRSGRRVGDGDNAVASKTAKSVGYVPSGMSRAEYSELRKTETEREQNLNYGAWGPRFRQTDRPNGDWMVMPNLWTFGRLDDRDAPQDGTNSIGIKSKIDPSTIGRRIPSMIRNYGLAFLLGYVLVDSLYSGYALWKFKQIQDLTILRKAHGLAYATYSLLLSVFGAVAGIPSPLQALKSPSGTKQIQSTMMKPAVLNRTLVKIALAVLQIPLWNSFMERVNRRMLWSNNRFAVTVAGTASTALTIFGIVLFR